VSRDGPWPKARGWGFGACLYHHGTGGFQMARIIILSYQDTTPNGRRWQQPSPETSGSRRP